MHPLNRCRPDRRKSAYALPSTLPIGQPMVVENLLEPLRRNRQAGHSTRDAHSLVDRGGDRRADPVDPGFAGTLDAEWVERAWRVLGDDHFERRGPPGGPPHGGGKR